MTFEEARRRLREEGTPEETIEAFLESFKRNPAIWKEFERFALNAVEADRKLGAKAIMERVRWETEVARREQFKVSNNWTAYYARIFAYKYPAYEHYFNFKPIRGVSA